MDELSNVPTNRRFVAINLVSDRISEETIVFCVCHLLQNHDLGKNTFKNVKASLIASGLAVMKARIFDATGLIPVSGTSG